MYITIRKSVVIFRYLLACRFAILVYIGTVITLVLGIGLVHDTSLSLIECSGIGIMEVKFL